MTAIRVLWQAAAVLAVLAACRVPAWGDFSYGGTEPSLEWMVDASNVAVAEIVEVVEDDEDDAKRHKYRLLKLLKRSKEFSLDVGHIVECPAPRLYASEPWQQGETVVVFFSPKDDSAPKDDNVRRAINLTRPRVECIDPEIKYLALDMYGKIVLDPDDLLRRIAMRAKNARRTAEGPFVPVNEGSFAYYPGDCELDSSEAYYDVRVPPDECFKEMLEEDANRHFCRKDFNTKWHFKAQSILYRLYTPLSDQQREEHRRRAIQETIQVAKVLQSRGERFFRFANYLSFPGSWYGSMSPDGRFVALLIDDAVEVQETDSGEVVYESAGCYTHYSRDRCMVFSSDGKHFAHLKANGNVAMVDLSQKKVKWESKFECAHRRNMYFNVFSFSPDQRYFCLVMDSGVGGGGANLEAWDVETGKTVLKPRDDWVISYYEAWFSGDSKFIKVRNLRKENWVWELPSGRLISDAPAEGWLPAHDRLEPRPKDAPAESSRPARSHNGKLQAAVSLGETKKLVIEQIESGKVLKSFDFTEMPQVRDLFFSADDEKLCIVTGWQSGWLVNVSGEKLRLGSISWGK